MIDWVRDNAWAAWLTVGVVLAAIETFTLDLVLLMFALGAISAAIAAGLGAPLWVCLALFALTSIALLFFVRPPLVEKLHRGPTLLQGHDHQVGRTAVVVTPVDQFRGQVQLGGELWSARTEGPDVQIDRDAQVRVLRIDGATAVVGPHDPAPEEK